MQEVLIVCSHPDIYPLFCRHGQKFKKGQKVCWDLNEKSRVLQVHKTLFRSKSGMYTCEYLNSLTKKAWILLCWGYWRKDLTIQRWQTVTERLWMDPRRRRVCLLDAMWEPEAYDPRNDHILKAAVWEQNKPTNKNHTTKKKNTNPQKEHFSKIDISREKYQETFTMKHRYRILQNQLFSFFFFLADILCLLSSKWLYWEWILTMWVWEAFHIRQLRV